jgi:6-phosphogluconolactonase
MIRQEVFPDAAALAEAAARIALDKLAAAIAARGQAVWVIAGGSTPMAAYRWLADHALEALDWSKVTVIIGDERCVPFDSPDSSWTQAEQAFLGRVRLSALSLRPASDQTAEAAAAQYAALLRQLPQTAQGLPRLDHVWLGVGEDGHTLSLFPDHPSSAPSDELVLAVHDSPKPPPNRISLGFKALQAVESCLVLAAGTGKSSVVGRALQADASLPVARAVATVEQGGGEVIWLLDEAASAEIQD